MGSYHATVVFVDANVWFSRVVRDWLGCLATEVDVPPFTVRWTEDVMAELLKSLRATHPSWAGSRITGIRDRLADTFSHGRVDDFVVDGSYRGSDPLDAHIHAAAVACGADVLLTFNTGDFVWDDQTASYEVMHPDDFLVLIDDGAPDLVRSVIDAMCAYWVSRSGEADLPAALVKAACPEFAERVRRHLQERM